MTEKAPAQKETKAAPAPAPTEEQDLFEDFALPDEFVEKKEGEPEAELPLWEADWEDEDVGGDFVQHLKEELGLMSS